MFIVPHGSKIVTIVTGMSYQKVIASRYVVGEDIWKERPAGP